MKKKTYSTNVTAVCANCNGEGKISIPGLHLGHGRYEDDTIEQCSVCEGSGLVNVSKNTVVTITAKHPQS